MISSYAKWLMQWRWLVIAVSLVLVGLAASGGRFLEFTNDYRAFFSPENPQLKAFEAIQNTYDKSDNVLFIITPKDGKVFTPQTLASIEWLTEQAWQTPYSTRVDSITNFQHTRAFEDDLEVADLVSDAEGLTNNQLADIRQIAAAEPLLTKRLINLDGTVTAVNVTVQLPGKSLTEVPEVANFARDLAQQLTARDANVQVGLSGIAMMNAAFGESAEKDMMTLVPLMFLVVIITLGILLRSVSPVIATVAVIIMAILVGMGLFGWSGLKMTAPLASAPTIILTMAVADAVHLLVSYLWGVRHGMDKHGAMIESLRINMQPIFLTSITTAIGFLSMNFSEVPPLAHLGNVVAVGVMGAFLLSVTFLPAFAVVLPVSQRHREENHHPFFDSISAFVGRQHKKLLWGMSLMTVGFVALLPLNEINDEMVKYFDTSVPFRADTDYASEKLIGPYSLEFSLDSGTENGIASPLFLAKVEEFVKYLKTFPEVVHIYTLTDTMKRLNKNLHGDDPALYRLPEDRELAAQYLLLYEMSLPYGLDLNNQVDVDKSATRITASTINMSSAQLLKLEETVNRWLAVNAPELKTETASTALMFAHLGQRNATSLTVGVILALLAISMILMVVLRSLRIGLISLVPNLVPAAIAFGIWGAIDGQIGMSVSIVAGMTLGIVVDDTVHFLSKYLRARREKGYSAREAVHYAFTHVGQALVVTTLVLVAGFAVLMFSTFKMNSDMGFVTALTIGIALIIDFLLLPALLIQWDGKKDDEKVIAIEPVEPAVA